MAAGLQASLEASRATRGCHGVAGLIGGRLDRGVSSSLVGRELQGARWSGHHWMVSRWEWDGQRAAAQAARECTSLEVSWMQAGVSSGLWERTREGFANNKYFYKVQLQHGT